MKRIKLLFFLLGITFLMGCQSFYKIHKDELREISDKDVVQIKFVSGEKLNITHVQHANITSNPELEIIKYSSTAYKSDSARTLYPLNKIEEIRIKRTNVQKSMFATFWITLGTTVLLLGIFCSNGCSVGG